ncbi:carbohydrate ABC transporter permease [Rhizobium sullae]|uniref:Carbohydrate ABC transporter membrane protein 1 (CUT1 family) n=1 Tax=Rhizobium sullae TaxID=50338 RepID=A0A4R3PU87_RHISU|nr:sugar ABC transporter permease [Rhizobium sullae]TCU11178.1 carbohydrate ABC transporter membrane protein 1 (CUT1 family) [Rhizobium sullae]
MSQSAVAEVPVQAVQRRRFLKPDTQTAVLFLLPSFLGFMAFMALPIAASLALSFTNWQLISTPSFAGFQNYVRLFTVDPAFYTVLRNTLFFAVEYLTLNIIVSLTLAVWISSLRHGKAIFRVIFFLPTFTPTIAASVVWLLIFTPDGLADSLIRSLGLGLPNFLLSTTWAMQAIVLVTLWANVGYNVVMFNAALDLVPRHYIEAATIDGANAWQRFWRIRLPLISPTIFFATVMTAITSLQVFDEIYAMTRGGPGSATATLGFAIYQKGFANFQMGYASALAWVMFIMIMALTILQFHMQRKWVHYGD